MNNKWRDRLRQAIEASGKSMRAVSLESGASPGYLFDILDNGREPSISKLMAMAETLGVSATWLLLGTEMGPQEEELVRLYAKLPDAQRRAILDLAGLADQERSE
jgi:transcriptional regulator with XRE-family HTH domain